MLLPLFVGFLATLANHFHIFIYQFFLIISFISCFMPSCHPANKKWNRDAQADCGLI